MPGDEVHLLGVRLVERRIVPDEDAARPVDQWCDFLPEGGGIGFETMQQASEGIVGGRIGVPGLDAGGLDATDDARGGDEEIDVVGIGATRCDLLPEVCPSIL